MLLPLFAWILVEAHEIMQHLFPFYPPTFELWLLKFESATELLKDTWRKVFLVSSRAERLVSVLQESLTSCNTPEKPFTPSLFQLPSRISSLCDCNL